jgi:hypothetical protein
LQSLKGHFTKPTINDTVVNGREVTLPAKAGQSESACRVACTWVHGHYWEVVEDSTEVSLLTASQLLHSHGMFTIANVYFTGTNVQILTSEELQRV